MRSSMCILCSRSTLLIRSLVTIRRRIIRATTLQSLDGNPGYSPIIHGYQLPPPTLTCTSSNEKMIGNEERLTVSKKDIDHRPDKISEQGTSDYIPMEIVEYMAKNQYERCLADADTSNNTSNAQTVEFTKVYGHRELNLFQPEISPKRKLGIKMRENGTIKRDHHFILTFVIVGLSELLVKITLLWYFFYFCPAEG